MKVSRRHTENTTQKSRVLSSITLPKYWGTLHPIYSFGAYEFSQVDTVYQIILRCKFSYQISCVSCFYNDRPPTSCK